MNLPILLKARVPRMFQRPTGDAIRPSPRSIPSLDGVRAISVIMVVISHYLIRARIDSHGALHRVLNIFGQGGLGVSAFFVISGFLITTLLLNESDHHGTIRLSRFYFRRSMRIFPPFYVFLLGASLLALHEGQPIPTATIATSAAYVSNYYPYTLSHPLGIGWYLAATWSLSVEEQFYLFWPLIVSIMSRRTAIWIGVAMLAISPFLRLATMHFFPAYAMEGQYNRMFHTTLDVLMTGCLLAFIVRDAGALARLQSWFRAPLLVATGLYLMGSTFISYHAPVFYQQLIGVSLTSICIAYWLGYVVLHADTLPGRILNWAPLRHIGMISYSIYLWQQVCFGPNRRSTSAWMMLVALLLAEASFWIIEKPSLRLRTVMEAAWYRRKPTAGPQA